MEGQDTGTKTKEMTASEIISSVATETKASTTKMNWTKIGIITLIIAAIILVIVLVMILTKPKVTQEMFNITYSLELENGTVLESNTKEFAKGTIASTLGFVTNKLDEELGILNKGDSKTIELEAQDAYGEYDESKAYIYERITRENRSMEVNRTNWITKNDFVNTFDEQPELNKSYQVEGAPWPYKVLELNESHVKLSQESTLNQEIPFGVFSYKVIEITTEKIKLRLEGNDAVIPTINGNMEIKFTENEIITTLTPEIGQEVQLENLPKARVTGMNSTHLFLDANHPHAGKKIIIKITLIGKKTVKEQDITGFVTCLDRAGFKIYGANWCGWTKKLVNEFGGFDIVESIYIECTEQQQLCNEKRISGYPTILIKDQPYEGERTFEGFERATGCRAPTQQKPATGVAPPGSC